MPLGNSTQDRGVQHGVQHGRDNECSTYTTSPSGESAMPQGWARQLRARGRRIWPLAGPEMT
jgi:hypothetical protein